MNIVFIAESILQSWSELIRNKTEDDVLRTPEELLAKTKELLGVESFDSSLMKPILPNIMDTAIISTNVLINEDIIKNWAALLREKSGSTEQMIPSRLLEVTRSILDATLDKEYELQIKDIIELLSSVILSSGTANELTVKSAIMEDKANMTLSSFEPVELQSKSDVQTSIEGIIKLIVYYTLSVMHNDTTIETHINLMEGKSAQLSTAGRSDVEGDIVLYVIKPLASSMSMNSIEVSKIVLMSQKPLLVDSSITIIDGDVLLTHAIGGAMNIKTRTAIDTNVSLINQTPLPHVKDVFGERTNVDVFGASTGEIVVDGTIEVKSDIRLDGPIVGEIVSINSAEITTNIQLNNPTVGLIKHSNSIEMDSNVELSDVDVVTFMTKGNTAISSRITKLYKNVRKITASGVSGIRSNIALTVLNENNWKYPTRVGNALYITQVYGTSQNNDVLEVV